jgi:hypothetical protein
MAYAKDGVFHADRFRSYNNRRILLKMILETCNHYEYCSMVANSGDSEYPIDYLFYLKVITQQQKLIDKISKNHGIEGPMKNTLVNFMHNQ